jgi:DNA-binding NtrC family response regulator
MSDGTLSFATPPRERPRREVRIVVDAGGPKERTVELELGTYTIGAGKDVNILIEDPHASRLHARLVVTPEGVDLEDLGSSNGTWLNGVSVKSARITTSTVVSIGRTAVRVELGEKREDTGRFGDAVGGSERMKTVFTFLEKLATTDLSVTLIGETGTGKDVLARALHQKSARGSAPFVVFDCGAVAANLIESELFGHVKGAFTGAIADRKGAFEQAHGGTIFLDEIGELPLELQPRLLRALEQRTVRRVGSTKDVSVDVRVVAATNRDLESEVRDGKFRQDLYFRLNAAVVQVPPLRERLDDLRPLVQTILKDQGKQLELSDSAVEVLSAHDWPGNVRELKNAVASAAAFADGPSLEARHFTMLNHKRRDPTLDRLPLGGRTLDALERAAIKQTLSRLGGNKTQAAQALGIASSTLYEKIKKYGI